MANGRKYTPRRAGRRWLAGAPNYVLDCFRHKQDDGRGFDVLFCGRLLGTMKHEPQDFAHVWVSGLELESNGARASFELSAYHAVRYRARNKSRRVKWAELPEEVRQSVEEWAKEDDAEVERAAGKPEPRKQPATIIYAAKTIIHQRDFKAEHGDYDRKEPNPEADANPENHQCFDDWAADILEAALGADGIAVGKRPEVYRCRGCGRIEAECSADPCEGVKRDRAS